MILDNKIFIEKLRTNCLFYKLPHLEDTDIECILQYRKTSSPFFYKKEDIIDRNNKYINYFYLWLQDVELGIIHAKNELKPYKKKLKEQHIATILEKFIEMCKHIYTHDPNKHPALNNLVFSEKKLNEYLYTLYDDSEKVKYLERIKK